MPVLGAESHLSQPYPPGITHTRYRRDLVLKLRVSCWPCLALSDPPQLSKMCPDEDASTEVDSTMLAEPLQPPL